MIIIAFKNNTVRRTKQIKILFTLQQNNKYEKIPANDQVRSFNNII